MTGRTDLLSPPYLPTETSTPAAGGTGWLLGDPKHYDRGACVDLVQLRGFILATQEHLFEAFALNTRRALDLGLFINGLPIATFELKNSLTKQNVRDAVEQYCRDRDPVSHCSRLAGA